MRQLITGLLLAGLLVVLPTVVFAEGGAEQAVEGTAKVITSPLEVPKQIVDDAQQTDPVTGTVTGAIKGTGEAVKQIGDGVGDILTAPFKE